MPAPGYLATFPRGVCLVLSESGARLQFRSERERRAWELFVLACEAGCDPCESTRPGPTECASGTKVEENDEAEVSVISPVKEVTLAADDDTSAGPMLDLLDQLADLQPVLGPKWFDFLVAVYQTHRRQLDRGSVSVAELADTWGVSVRTVQRRLNLWHKGGSEAASAVLILRYFIRGIHPARNPVNPRRSRLKFDLRPLDQALTDWRRNRQH